MSRPASAKTRGTGTGTLSSVDKASYEDLLVAQYLDELRKSAQHGQQSKGTSPYMQKLAHTHVVLTSNITRRPQSAHVSLSKSKGETRCVTNIDTWDGEYPHAEVHRKRPLSAPVYKRPLSASYSTGSHRPYSAKSGFGRTKALYRKQPRVIVVTAFKNGDRDVFCKVAAPSIRVLLEYCTEKLGLPNAARRIFLESGREVFMPKEIPRGADVYISTGEPFKSPYNSVKRQNKLSKNVMWTMNGLVWTQEGKKHLTKPRLSKRFRSLIEQSRRRVLVFKNGHGSQGSEIVADPDRFEDFLVACTAKLDLGSYARILYDWEGKEIAQLDDAPVLDQCLQTWSTPVLGPLWVSKGEGFSPKGVEEFLKGLIAYTQAKLKEAKHYKEQLQFGQDEEMKDKVQIVAILSMSDQEIEETLEIVDKDIEDFSNALNRLKEQREKIQDLLKEEDDIGYEYKLKHIDKLDYDHKLVGTKGLRLKVYENGSYDDPAIIYFNIQQSMRGVGQNKELLLARLLDQCSSSSFLANPKKNPAIRPVAKKLFNSMGQEIKNVFDLEFDQEVWLSFGEPWKNLYTFALTTVFDNIAIYDRPGGGIKVLKEPLRLDVVKGMEKSVMWEAYSGLPPDVKSTPEPPGSGLVVGLPEDEEGHQPVPSGVTNDDPYTYEIQPNMATILCAKNDPSIMIIGSIVMDVKDPKQSSLWPAEVQNWVISKAGYIYSRAMPQLVLTVLDVPVTTNLSHPVTGPKEKKVEGYLVGLQKKQSGFANQQWRFTTEANICATSHPDLMLTYLGAKNGSEDTQLSNENDAGIHSQSGQPLYVAVCQRLTGRDAKAQRWAVKQERFENLGQWKHTDAGAEWHKKAYSWPVKADGSLNENYDWPMEGYLIPYAPPLKRKKPESSASAVPLRLLVMKNGVRDIAKSVPVVGPDLSNMRKDIATKEKKGGKKRKDADAESIDVDEMLHCDEDLTVLKLEFILFLERCTALLDLPFAARRLFDETGREHFSLATLQRDQLVYVSCGEPWSDPNLSKAEQQRRYLLANLASDVAKIQQFIALRDPQDLVLEVDGVISPGTKLCVSQCAINIEAEQSKEQERYNAMLRAKEEDMKQRERQLQELAESEAQMTAHEKNHKRADERLERLKWPWERVVNGGYEEESDEDEKQYSNKELYRKFKRRPKHRGDDALTLQKFIYEDGYIALAQHTNLVLGVKETEGRISEVILVKRCPDDINQRWIIQANGVIQAKHNSQMVLTVSLPSSASVDEDGAAISYLGCHVTVQALRVSQFGRANQRWLYEQSTGFIHAFHTDQMDKEITAANKANVCTYAVMGDTAIDQPGYIVQVQQEKGAAPKKILVCSSCARAMRGRHKLEKVQGPIDFACSMGNAKELGIKQVGSFQCLNGKVDLSTYEAEHTLEEWQTQLEKWREELSVRVIAREISAAKVPYTVKVLAYKNGEGRLKPGELIVGSSVPGILDQCVHRLGLNQAARRLYTADGTLVLDTDDLIEWVQQEYVRQAKRQLRAEAKARRQNQQGDSNDKETPDGSKYLDKVDLDSDMESSLEDDEDQNEDGEEQQQSLDQKDGGKRVRFVETSSEEIDITVGSPAINRRETDPWSNVIIIPNPRDTVKSDGQLTTWKLFARQPGQICLQVLRPSGEDPMAFFLTGQVTYDIPSAGQHVINIKDRPLKVKHDDVIGFYSMSTPVIPYDVEETSEQCPFYLLPPEKPKLGQMLNFDVMNQSAGRKYSVCAIIRPNEVAEKPVADPTPARPKTAARSGRKPEKPKKRVEIKPPPIDMILRYPVEVWVSMGEPFIKPEKVEKTFEQEQLLREERAAVSYELEKEKHVLRQMRGRRYDEQSPGSYKMTRDPYTPVLKEGHWQEPTVTELQKHDMVHQLQTHLAEMRSAQKPKGVKVCNVKTTRRLYTQPAMKRLLIFPNGESLERAQYVWGESLEQLCSNATTRLSLRKPGKYLFGLDGTMIDDFDSLERDQLVCVASDKHFLRPKESQQVIEIKARWGRARKQYGPHATDIIVTSNKNPQVDVDPFGPSKLAGGQGK